MAKTKFSTVMDEQGRRLVWLAGELGVTVSTVSRWMSGDRRIPPSRRAQIASLLGVREEEINVK